MKTKGFGATDIGRRRSNNEDTYFSDDELGLYVVCDGMGGMSGGEVAAWEASKSVAEFFVTNELLLTGARRTGDFDRLVSMAIEAVKLASSNIWKISEQQNMGGMGTTLTMLIVAGHKGVVASVGDSRAYLVHDRELVQVTKDHTYAEELQYSGLDVEYVRNYRHVLTRVVGYEESVEVDTFLVDLAPCDRVLLGSDGLSNYFDDLDELRQYVIEEPVATLPDLLVAMANERGGIDNITAVVVDVIPASSLQAHLHNRKGWSNSLPSEQR